VSALSPILRSLKWGDGRALSFWCPGCKGAHIVIIESDKRPKWGWNRSATAPTFTPSILVTSGRALDPSYEPDPDFPAPPEVCHSFVTDGRIQFLGDCKHALAGQTVDIPEWPNDYHDGDVT
jgi:Family of unknown function (DUF6527)